MTELKRGAGRRGLLGGGGGQGDTRLMYLRGKIGFKENKAQAGR